MKVNGLGGVFIKAKNPDQLYRWYEDKVQSSDASCTLNFQVDHLAPLLSNLAEAGVHIVDHLEETPNGRFAWIFDPEGNKIELWEPRSYESSVIDLPEPE